MAKISNANKAKTTHRLRTPRLDSRQMKEYIRLHLFNELRWLLGAATEWSIQEQLNLKEVGYDIQVYAMDSTYLHARALFEFFVGPTTRNRYGCDAYLGPGSVLSSSSYDNWSGPLHSFLLHAQDRSKPRPLDSSGVKNLNEMPVDFAREILKLWAEFERMLAKSGVPEIRELMKLAREKRQEAIKGAECVVHSAVAKQHAKEKGKMLKPVFVFD